MVSPRALALLRLIASEYRGVCSNGIRALGAPPHPTLSPSGGEGTRPDARSLTEGAGRGEGWASARAWSALQPVDREDVLADQSDLAHRVLLGPVPRVGRKFHGCVPEPEGLEPVRGQILVAGARDLHRPLHSVDARPPRRPCPRHFGQVVAAATEGDHTRRVLEQ